MKSEFLKIVFKSLAASRPQILWCTIWFLKCLSVNLSSQVLLFLLQDLGLQQSIEQFLKRAVQKQQRLFTFQKSLTEFLWMLALMS